MKTLRIVALLIFSVLAAFFINTPESIKAEDTLPVVVLSPGHGWWNVDSQQVDPGAAKGDLIEKDITLEVARNAQGYLQRCPVEVRLTRNGDDSDHTLYDVDEIVNAYRPTVGVSIHTNSVKEGNPSGTEGWYTINGYDDGMSRTLASLLADRISGHLNIVDRGAKPETDYPEGGLYIHYWNAPSALIEIGFLQGDAELLRTKKTEFGRSIAQAILEFLNIDPHCADRAVPQDFYIATYFPNDITENEISLQNDGLVTWKASEYNLVNQGNQYGAAAQYTLSGDVQVNHSTTWNIPIMAPRRAGIYRQEWILTRGTNKVNDQITVYMVVVPERARQLKEEIDNQIEELRQQGEKNLNEFVQQIQQKILNWLEHDLPGAICGQNLMLVGIIAGMLIYVRRNRKP